MRSEETALELSLENMEERTLELGGWSGFEVGLRELGFGGEVGGRVESSLEEVEGLGAEGGVVFMRLGYGRERRVSVARLMCSVSCEATVARMKFGSASGNIYQQSSKTSCQSRTRKLRKWDATDLLKLIRDERELLVFCPLSLLCFLLSEPLHLLGFEDPIGVEPTTTKRA